MTAVQSASTGDDSAGPMLAGLDQALQAATWITPSDRTAVVLARKLATALDVCDEPAVLVKLASQLESLLRELHMTPATRLDAGEVSSEGATIIDAWDRLRAAPGGQQTTRRADGRTAGGKTGR